MVSLSQPTNSNTTHDNAFLSSITANNNNNSTSNNNVNINTSITNNSENNNSSGNNNQGDDNQANKESFGLKRNLSERGGSRKRLREINN